MQFQSHLHIFRYLLQWHSHFLVQFLWQLLPSVTTQLNHLDQDLRMLVFTYLFVLNSVQSLSHV